MINVVARAHVCVCVYVCLHRNDCNISVFGRLSTIVFITYLLSALTRFTAGHILLFWFHDIAALLFSFETERNKILFDNDFSASHTQPYFIEALPFDNNDLSKNNYYPNV